MTFAAKALARAKPKETHTTDINSAGLARQSASPKNNPRARSPSCTGTSFRHGLAENINRLRGTSAVEERRCVIKKCTRVSSHECGIHRARINTQRNGSRRRRRRRSSGDFDLSAVFCARKRDSRRTPGCNTRTHVRKTQVRARSP